MSRRQYTDTKENKNVLLCKEIQMGSDGKSYVRKGFLIYEEMPKYFLLFMRRSLVIYDFAPDPSEFPNIWGKFYFIFYQCTLHIIEIYWTVTRRSLAVCRTVKFFAFLVFYAACLHLIVLAVDRCVLFLPVYWRYISFTGSRWWYTGTYIFIFCENCCWNNCSEERK
jgi:hypothetical protein